MGNVLSVRRQKRKKANSIPWPWDKLSRKLGGELSNLDRGLGAAPSEYNSHHSLDLTEVVPAISASPCWSALVFYNAHFFRSKDCRCLEKNQQRKVNTTVEMVKRRQAKPVQPEIEWCLRLVGVH